MTSSIRILLVAAATLVATAPALAQSAPAQRTVTTVSTGTVAPPPSAPGDRTPSEIVIRREVFDYSGSGRRDPYRSLMTTTDIRPLLSDLRLTAVAFDAEGDNSVAFLRDAYSKTQYRIRVGQQLGRLRVSAIRQKSVQFTMEEFGFNRIETLTLGSDSTKTRNP